MKRNRESKYRQRILNCLHKKKSKQKDLDKLITKYHITYFDMYQFAVKSNFLYSKSVIYKMFDHEMDNFFKSLGDMSELPLDLFEPTNCLGRNKRPYYLGIDFARGNDWAGFR